MKKQVFSQILLLLVIAPLFSACVQVGEELSEESTGEQRTEQTAIVSEYEVVAGGPNEYKVLIGIPAGTQVVLRESGQGGSRRNLVVEVENGAFVDRSPELGTSQTYHMGFYHNGLFQPLKTIQVLVPRDLVFSGPFSVDNHNTWENINRVYISRDAVITTHGFNIRLHANYLFSEGGIIRSFEPGATAFPRQNGRSGGRIEMKIAKAQGYLFLQMRGEQQGNQYGDGGNSGSFDIRIAEDNTMGLEVAIENGTGVKSGSKERSCFYAPRETKCYPSQL